MIGLKGASRALEGPVPFDHPDWRASTALEIEDIVDPYLHCFYVTFTIVAV
jgi:hypothetical protein